MRTEPSDITMQKSNFGASSNWGAYSFQLGVVLHVCTSQFSLKILTMNNFFEILPIGFHIALLSLYAIGIQMGPFARERFSPTAESPLIWKTKSPSFWFYLLVWEDSFFLNFNLLLAVYLSFSGLWWYGLIYAAEPIVS